ncbi:MAG: CtsR family transcriptional regulator, partial [Clostridia bacterium]|nr:CtsR family transcriptional regulator [Clostridia bacterium]
MRISDLVAQYIINMLEENDGGAEIRRNELAETIGCVPSQISYVITSRFTPEQGYIVESRRGGGGYIKITRVQLDKRSAIMHIINSIGDSVDSRKAASVIKELLTRN